MRSSEVVARIYSPSDRICIAQYDEENAFSYLMTPPWWWPWMATPPIQVRCLPPYAATSTGRHHHLPCTPGTAALLGAVV